MPGVVVAIREIVTLGHPVLKQKCKKIHRIDDSVRQLVEDLTETVGATPNGAGLAAPQIGVPLRAIVTHIDGKTRAVINPEIVETSEDEIEAEEGCLSIPGWYGPVWRKRQVLVRGLSPTGKRLKIKADEFEARVFQHEIDHLDGVLFIERMEDRNKLHRVESDEQEQELEDEQVFA
jgi:peptide deformylase